MLIAGSTAALGFGARTALCGMDRHDRVLVARAHEAVGKPPDPSGRVPHRGCVIAVPSVVAQVRPELLRIASQLRADHPPGRGVAAAERLLCCGRSSLFGRDVELLRQDLRRVAYLLDQ